MDLHRQATIIDDHTQTIVLLLVQLREILTIEDIQHLQEAVIVLAAIILEVATITIEAIQQAINSKATVADALETRALTAASESEICHRLNDKNVNEKFQYVTKNLIE